MSPERAVAQKDDSQLRQKEMIARQIGRAHV